MTDHLFLLTLKDKKEQQKIRKYWASRILSSLHPTYNWEEVRGFTGRTRQTWQNVCEKNRLVCNSFIKRVCNSMMDAGFKVPTDQIILDFNEEVPVSVEVDFKRYEITETKTSLHFSVEEALQLLMSDVITPNQFQAVTEVTKQIIKSKSHVQS
tara:strand:+ start:952 stop:1413 length:462 start_codon:yes stop_codon:yes gene_type:complete